jgi:hypothetical protein
MQIVELGDNSMVIMKDSEDPPWVSVGDVYRNAIRKGKRNIRVWVLKEAPDLYVGMSSSDYIYTAGRLLLFFKDNIKPKFKLHSHVILETSS